MSLDDFDLEKKYTELLSETYKATKKGSKELFTITKTKKEGTSKDVMDLQKQAIDILKNVHHPNIIKLIEYREDAKSYICICEYCSDENLEDYLKARC